MTTTPPTISLVIPRTAGTPVAHALARLTAALEGRGWRCVRAEDVEQVTSSGSGTAIVAALPPHDQVVERLMASAGLQAPDTPESIGFCPLAPKGERPAMVLILGGDERGLMYALLAAAGRRELCSRS